MKTFNLILLGIAYSLPAASFAADWLVQQDCSCILRTPVADSTTANDLNQWHAGTGQYAGFAGAPAPKDIAPGDVVTICNGSYCAQYTYGKDGSWTNGSAKPETANPPQKCNP
ncbi:hypothetical protein SAMN04487785_10911 [Dyella jiangningensis]|uniref:hypothetical protein n=1 Tax=Dyella sp. AtDHG13 TaxID=1938897 RepID=UPI0008833FC9|nr:hypothetical protein [Dyella sp. AtDHG13]PXV56888.1 hypothetical protein BDW41_10810 [Dyella sp. AtDHG13]SDK59824.1 hypothetical protein SAMN04487785_10911 [Dyella jiangningensis]